MTEPSVAALRDLAVERGQELTFADLSEPVLEDLAAGWADGKPLARLAAELLSRMDGISALRRDQQIAGRAALTLARRRGADVRVAAEAHEIRLLGQPLLDSGDPEAEAAFERRRDQYDSLARLDLPYEPEQFATDAAGALESARTRGAEARLVGLPPDPVGPEHSLALLGLRLPPGLRLWFHEQYDEPQADRLAWKFFLAGRALARHRENMAASGVLPPGGPGGVVPPRLLEAVLAQDLGQLALTAVIEI